jgi:hypothetical protein
MAKRPEPGQFWRVQDEAEAQEAAGQARDEDVVCMARGHRWPDMNPRKALPRGIRIGPLRRDGCFSIEEFCERCGESRVTVTTPGKLFGGAGKRSYVRPAERPVMARGLGGRAFWQAELGVRMDETIMQVVLAATVAAAQNAGAEVTGNGARPGSGGQHNGTAKRGAA